MSRLVDRGAIFAGWVGIGMAAVIVLSFELVIPLQAVVFLCAPLAGLLIGYYANSRSEIGPRAGDAPLRWPRMLGNALYAGLVTGLSLAILYGAVRLLFFYADQGYQPNGQGGAATCRAGADCVFQRYLADPSSAAELRNAGVTDAAQFETYFLRQQWDGALTLVLWTTLPALAGGAMYAASRPRRGPGAAAPELPAP